MKGARFLLAGIAGIGVGAIFRNYTTPSEEEYRSEKDLKAKFESLTQNDILKSLKDAKKD
jgi:hypothetical protein